MALFDTQLDLDKITGSPDEDYNVNSILQKAFYKESGDKTAFGKASDFAFFGTPGEVIGRDLQKQDVGERYSDNLSNSIGESQAARTSMIGAAKTAVGAATGNTGMAASGVTDATRGVARYTGETEPRTATRQTGMQLVSSLPMFADAIESDGVDMDKTKTEATSTKIDPVNKKPQRAKKGDFSEPKLPNMKRGSKLKGASHSEGGVDLIDSITKEKVGEAEGGERVFSKEDTKKIEKAVKKKDKNALMNHVNKALKRQDRNTANIYQDGGKIDFSELSLLGKEIERRQNDKDPITKKYTDKSLSSLKNLYKKRLKSYVDNNLGPARDRMKSKIKGLDDSIETVRNSNLSYKDKEKRIDDLRSQRDNLKSKLDNISKVNTQTLDNKGYIRWKNEKTSFGSASAGLSFDPDKHLQLINEKLGITPSDESNYLDRQTDQMLQDALNQDQEGGKESDKTNRRESDKTTRRESGSFNKKETKPLSTSSDTDKDVENKSVADKGDPKLAPRLEINDLELPNEQRKAEDDEEMTGFLQGALSAGNVLDVVKLGVGINNATKDLPEWEIPQEWQKYTDTLETMANEGLTAAERGLYKEQSDRTFAYDIDAIERGAGGSSARYLGNAGAAAQRKYASDRKLASLEAQERDKDLQRYGQALQATNELDRMKFEDEYQEDMLTKKSGANLARSGIQGIMDRIQYNKTYGEGSEYDKLMELKTQQAEEALEMKRLQKNSFVDMLADQDVEPGSAATERRAKRGTGNAQNAKKRSK